MSLSFDLYQSGDSWLHRLDPRAKLWMVLLIGILALVFRHVGLLATLLLLTHLALISARVPARQMWWLWTRMAPILVMILLLQPIFMPGPGPDLLRLGPLRITVSGLMDGLSFALRAAAMAFIAAILLLTTDPANLVQGLVKLGLPYPWGLTAGLAIRYLPIAYGLYVTVSEAQQARGWIIGQGNLFRRARAYLPIFVATIIASLRLSTNLGLALAARGLGYPARRTVLHEIRFSPFDWLAVTLATVVFLFLLGLRFWLGLGAEPW